ncbi:hypothetical protein [Rhodococcus jostii]|jgi:hypothetical protein|nr:hypothetical protein [Rhodococcus jostii]
MGVGSVHETLVDDDGMDYGRMSRAQVTTDARQGFGRPEEVTR